MKTSLDPNQPLPAHTPVDYWEAYAQLVLQHINPIKYAGLYLSDKPDLQDQKRSLGVEVTQAISPNAHEAECCYLKLLQEQNETKRLRLNERIGQCSASIRSGILLGPNGHDDFSFIHNAHHKKLQKLNAGGYQRFEHNELFIRSDILADERMCFAALKDMLKQAKSWAASFDMVTVSTPSANITFDLENTSFEKLPFSKEKQCGIACLARKVVIAGGGSGAA